MAPLPSLTPTVVCGCPTFHNFAGEECVIDCPAQSGDEAYMKFKDKIKADGYESEMYLPTLEEILTKMEAEPEYYYITYMFRVSNIYKKLSLDNLQLAYKNQRERLIGGTLLAKNSPWTMVINTGITICRF